MMITIIAAVDNKFGIGKNGLMPWYIPDDLKRFKELTKNSVVIMGRVTYESIGAKPLPNRINIVITKNPESVNKKCMACIDFKYAIQLATTMLKPIFIIGGSGIYKEAFNVCDKVLLTKIDSDFNCDVFFPNFIEELFDKIEEDPKCYKGLNYKYVTYNLKKSYKIYTQQYIKSCLF